MLHQNPPPAASLLTLFALAFAWSWSCCLPMSALQNGLTSCSHRTVVGGRLWTQPGGAGGGGPLQWQVGSARVVGKVPALARGRTLGGTGVCVARCPDGAGGHQPRCTGRHPAPLARCGSYGHGSGQLFTDFFRGWPLGGKVRLARIRLARLASTRGLAQGQCAAGRGVGSLAPAAFLQRRHPAKPSAPGAVCDQRHRCLGALCVAVQPHPRQCDLCAGVAHRRQRLGIDHSGHGAPRWQPSATVSNCRRHAGPCRCRPVVLGPTPVPTSARRSTTRATRWWLKLSKTCPSAHAAISPKNFYTEHFQPYSKSI